MKIGNRGHKDNAFPESVEHTRMLEEIMHDYDGDIEYDNNIGFYHDYLTLYLNQESVELLYTKGVRGCEQLYAIEEAWLDDCMRGDAKDLEYYIDMELLST